MSESQTNTRGGKAVFTQSESRNGNDDDIDIAVADPGFS